MILLMQKQQRTRSRSLFDNCDLERAVLIKKSSGVQSTHLQGSESLINGQKI